MKAFDKWYGHTGLPELTEAHMMAEAGWIAAHNYLMVPVAAMMIAALIAGMLLGYAKAYSVRHVVRTVYVLTTNAPAQSDVMSWGTFTNLVGPGVGGWQMNTNFLSEFKVAIIALLAVLNSTNSPVKPSEPVAVLGMTFTNLVSTNSIELLVYTNVSVPSPLDGPSAEKWPTLPVTTNEWVIPVGTVYRSDSLTNAFVLTSRTNWITDAEIKVLATSGQVCRVRGHIWEDGCGVFGCLVIHYGPQRHCLLCGKTETQQIGEWR